MFLFFYFSIIHLYKQCVNVELFPLSTSKQIQFKLNIYMNTNKMINVVYSREVVGFPVFYKMVQYLKKLVSIYLLSMATSHRPQYNKWNQGKNN